MQMHTAVQRPFERVSLSNQFLLVIAAILLASTAIFGTWVGRQIEGNTVNRAAAIAAVYVESILGTQMDEWAGTGAVSADMRATLDRVFVNGPLRRKVVSFKLWSPDGRIIYSTEPGQEGRHYGLSAHLAAALRGTVQAGVSDLAEIDEQPERARWPQLLEVYVPVRHSGKGKVIAVAEFYHTMEHLDRDIRSSQLQSWVLVTLGAAAIFIMLYGLMRRASGTILAQQQDLRDQLHTLRAALDENEHMRERISEAGARTTALNEQLLRRIAADLHDGPAQALAFALMRFDELMLACSGRDPDAGDAPRDLDAIHKALRASLDELRAISAGLGVPGIAGLSLAATLQRAVRDVARDKDIAISTAIDESLDEAPLAVKITAYRLLQESLTNCWRHARGAAVRVRVEREPGNDAILIEVTDAGPGFDADAAGSSARLGLAFMRERVRLLGGDFTVATAPGHGTTLMARIPLVPPETTHD